MNNNQKILAVIPARGGSKGVPRKNIREVCGKPLIGYTIEQALKSTVLDKIVVSSEDDEILSVAENYGVTTLKRPLELAQDNSPGVDAVLHAIEQFPNYDYVVLLQPTSPLRSFKDIDNTLKFCCDNKFPCSVTVSESQNSPYWMFTIGDNGKLNQIMQGDLPSRRQELPTVYMLNGAVYVAEIPWLKKKKNFIYKESAAYIMPFSRSLDIDTIDDVNYLEYVLHNKSSNKV